MTPAGRPPGERGRRPRSRTNTRKRWRASTSDQVHALHYLLKLLDNMQRIDIAQGASEEDDAG